MAVVYFDIEKAYDSGVRLNNWVPDVLSNRTFSVKVGASMISPVPNVDLQFVGQKREWTKRNEGNIGLLVKKWQRVDLSEQECLYLNFLIIC